MTNGWKATRRVAVAHHYQSPMSATMKTKLMMRLLISHMLIRRRILSSTMKLLKMMAQKMKIPKMKMIRWEGWWLNYNVNSLVNYWNGSSQQFPSDDHPPLIRPIHNPHLEPGDVDLFASDSITQTVQGDGTSPSLLDRSWNATPYSLLYSQKRLSSGKPSFTLRSNPRFSTDTTDSLSLEQTNIEPTAPATSETLVATDPTQFMTVQGGLDDYSGRTIY